MNENLYKELYDLEFNHWWFVGKKNIVMYFISNIRNQKKKKILDIGCGSGLMLSELKKYGSVYGLDNSEEAIKYSKLIFDGDIKKGALPYEIPYDDNSFDIITVLDVLEHIEKDTDALKKIYNLLDSQGKVIITVPALMSLWTNHDLSHDHKRRYILKELKSKIKTAGFKIEKISYYNSLLFIPIYIIRQINKIFKKQKTYSDAKKIPRFINGILKYIFTFEKNILKYFNFPIGVSIIAICKKEN